MIKISKENPQVLAQAGIDKKTQLNDISSQAQRQRLLASLRKKPITTIQARHELNILMPAARIFELRHLDGHNIKTCWVEDITPERKRHRVAKYVLMSSGRLEVCNG